jgi:hypothetical protein
MQAIFDHIIASIIGVTVIMALMSTTLRVQQAGVEQVSAHAAKTKAISLSRWLEDDITSLGANFGRNLHRFELPVVDDEGNTTEWVFYSDSVHVDATLRYLTRYTTRVVDSIEQQGEMRPLYQLDREVAVVNVVDGEAPNMSFASWTGDGRSVATLSRFRIGLVARDGTSTTNVEAADYIRVEFSMVPEFERHRGYLHELYWSTLLKVRPFWQPPQS